MFTVVGIIRPDGGYTSHPAADTIMRPNDRLRLFGLPEQIARFSRALEETGIGVVLGKLAHRAALLGAVMLALTLAVTSSAGSVLDGVRRVAVSVDVRQPIEGVLADELERRVVTFVAKLEHSLALDKSSTDRLQLTITVSSYSSSELRGFPLPFSGTYAIGTVRLTLHRAVEIVGGPPRIVSASVWERERQIATRGSAARGAVDRAVEELLDELRGVRGPSR